MHSHKMMLYSKGLSFKTLGILDLLQSKISRYDYDACAISLITAKASAIEGVESMV